jgi:hypothetical protein
VACQQRSWRDQAVAAQRGGQQPGQRGQDGPGGPVEPGTGDLGAQDRDLMAQHHDLGVLRGLPAAEQLQPAKDPDDGEVQESDRHIPRSCLMTVSGANRQVTVRAEFWSGTGLRLAQRSRWRSWPWEFHVIRRKRTNPGYDRAPRLAPSRREPP